MSDTTATATAEQPGAPATDAEPAPPVPAQSQRDIFPYWNGEKLVMADPVVLWRGLIADPNEDFHTLYDAANRPPEDPDNTAAQRAYWAAHGRLAERVRTAFRLAVLDDDGNGVTEAEACGLARYFCAWNLAKKNAGAPSANGLQPTDGPPEGSASTSETGPLSTAPDA